MSAPTPTQRPRWTDPRLWVGVAITVAALWYAFRGIDFSQLGREMAKADLWWLIPGSVACYLAAIYFRALRWRYLVRFLGEFSTSSLFRSLATGFMANNLFPFRMGELVRAWMLAREHDTSGAAVFGTVIVERVIDAVVVLGMAAVVLGTAGAQATGLDPRKALVLLSLIASIPLLGVLALRRYPDFFVGMATRVAGWVLPTRIVDRIDHMLRQIAAGLSGLRGARDILWVGLHSLFVWLVLAVLPFWLAIRSLGLDMGGLAAELWASTLMMILVGAAIAVPSVPGFAGTYHAACKAALVPLGVEPEVALAAGTLAHIVFWITMTGAGLAVLRFRGTSLDVAFSSGEPVAGGTGAPPAPPGETASE
ncbi:MAG: hypothetical protein CL910_19655 [Deltaproteobacteria bacterium]|jgi:hypothetical protein|nr:hypothetical protein [Deltaproteobacteria bacterium]